MKFFRHKKWILPFLVLAGILVIVRSGVFAGGKEQEKAAAVQSVKVVEAQYVDTVPSLQVNGTLEGQTAATISAKLSGRVEEVLVQEGQQVKAGDPLIRLETLELANAVRQAADNVSKAQANYDLALNDYNRYQTLYDKGAVSEQQLDGVKAKLKTAQADLSSATANQSSAEKQYSYGVISSPVDGVVANKTVTVGQVVSPGASLMMVQDINQVYAVVNIEQKDLGRVKIGQKAGITVDAYPEKVFAGTVEVMNPEIGAASRMFRTKIKIDNSAQELKAGMFANVRLVTGSNMKVLAVPQAAVVQKQNLYYVFTAENGKAVRHQIEIDEVSGSTIVVKSGLEAGKQIIITAVSRLKDGDAVQTAP